MAKAKKAVKKGSPAKKATKKAAPKKRSAPKKAAKKKAAKKKAAKKGTAKKNKLGVKNSLVNNINARKKKGVARSKGKSKVTKKSYKNMQDNWGKG